MAASCSLPTAYEAALNRLEVPRPIAMAKWMQFAQARLQFGTPNAVCHKPRFSFDDDCQGNYGFCHAPATHLVGLVDNKGASFLVTHFNRHADTPWGCEMSADPNDGHPVYLPVCEAHQQPFSEALSPNTQVPVDRSVE